MKRYKYKARDSVGVLVTGEVEATNERMAAKLLREKNLIIISLRLKGKLPFSSLTNSGKASVSDVTNFTRQFATMVNAGLPLTEALLILRSQSDGTMQKIASQILADVEEGQSLSSSMSKFPKTFTKTYIALVKAGETGGVLDEVLARLSDNMEKQEEFKGKIKSAMIYPVIIVIGMVIVAFVMMIFVIPKMTELYDQFDAELPFATKALIAVSGFMSKYWYGVIGITVFAIYSFSVYKKTTKGKKVYDEFMLKIPIIGELRRKVVLTELTRTLSLMVGSGVSILEALSISSEAIGNVVISEAVEDVGKMVEKGFPVALAFSRHPEAFPFIVSQMVAVGEETGKMDEVLAKVAHVFEVESDQKVKALTAAIEPIILIILGVGVAFLVIAIILPIYNLTSNI